MYYNDQDFDKHNYGYITESQFLRTLSFGNLNVQDSDVCVH